jgi:hypothetical protein
MTLPVPDGIAPDALVLIIHGPVPFLVAVTGSRGEAVIEAYRQAGIDVEIVSRDQRAAS